MVASGSWCAPSLAHYGASSTAIATTLTCATSWQPQEKIRWQIDFAVSIAKIQLQAGHYFLFKNPANSRAWLEDPLQQLEKDPRVYVVVGHACAHNLQSIVELGNSSASLTGG